MIYPEEGERIYQSKRHGYKNADNNPDRLNVEPEEGQRIYQSKRRGYENADNNPDRLNDKTWRRPKDISVKTSWIWKFRQ